MAPREACWIIRKWRERVRLHWGRDLVTQGGAYPPFCASSPDGVPASGAPARRVPARESSGDSAVAAASGRAPLPYWPDGRPAWRSSVGYDDCWGKEQRTPCNGGTCMRAASSWPGEDPQPSAPCALANPSPRTKTKEEEERLVWKGKKKTSEPRANPSARCSLIVHVQIGRIRPFSDRSPQAEDQRPQHLTDRADLNPCIEIPGGEIP